MIANARMKIRVPQISKSGHVMRGSRTDNMGTLFKASYFLRNVAPQKGQRVPWATKPQFKKKGMPTQTLIHDPDTLGKGRAQKTCGKTLKAKSPRPACACCAANAHGSPAVCMWLRFRVEHDSGGDCPREGLRLGPIEAPNSKAFKPYLKAESPKPTALSQNPKALNPYNTKTLKTTL